MNRVEEITPEKMGEVNEKLERMAIENQTFNGKNLLNIYTCEQCGNKMVTKDLHVGTTPFTMACDDPICPGPAVSAGYPRNLNADSLPHDYEWFRPLTEEECGESRDRVRNRAQEYAMSIPRNGVLTGITLDEQEIEEAIESESVSHLLMGGLERRQTAHGKERVQRLKGRWG